MQSARGNLEVALKAYGDGLAIAEKLARQDPSNTEWQRDLIVSNVKLAEVVQHQARAADTMRHYGAALAVARELQARGRLAPVDGWMVKDLEARIERVSAQAGP